MTVGTCPLRLPLGYKLLLKDCYYILIVSRNLIFISVLAQDNYNFYFNKDMSVIYFEKKVVTCTFLIDGLYHLHMDTSVNINEQTVNAVGSKRLKDRTS